MPGILDVPLPIRLAEAVARELAAEEPSPERLADSVRAYALEAYARGVPPERLLVSLKAIVSKTADGLDSRMRAALIAVLVPFALEGYYLDPWVRLTGQVRALRRRSATSASPDSSASG